VAFVEAAFVLGCALERRLDSGAEGSGAGEVEILDGCARTTCSFDSGKSVYRRHVRPSFEPVTGSCWRNKDLATLQPHERRQRQEPYLVIRGHPEAQAVAPNVRQVANRTFYRRDGRWVDATATKQQESQARRVKQFSNEHFELARRHGRQLTQYVVFDEPVLVTLEGQAYLVEP
jgi:hypothetical protein